MALIWMVCYRSAFPQFHHDKVRTFAFVKHPIMKKSFWTPQNIALVILPVLLLTLLGISIVQRNYAEPLFIHTTYYFLLATVVCWAGTYLIRRAT